MRRFVLTMMVAGLMGTAAFGQDRDVQATIGAQFQAFKADDFSGAFTHASPLIQNLFRTPENFGMMVRRGYPMVWRPADIKYLELREKNGGLWQKVRITDEQGTLHLLDYEMIRLENGWKINAVQLLEMPRPNV